MRKFKNLLLIGALVFSLTACNSTPAEDTETTEVAEETEEVEETEQAEEEKEEEAEEADSEEDAVLEAVLFSKAIHTELTDGGPAVLYMTVPGLTQEVGEEILRQKAEMYASDDREFTQVDIYFYPEDYETTGDQAPSMDDAVGQASQALPEGEGTVTIK